jgi:hypothetical protein
MTTLILTFKGFYTIIADLASISLIAFIFLVRKFIKKSVEYREEFSYKLNDFPFRNYAETKDTYINELEKGTEDSILMVKDSRGDIVYHGNACDYYSTYEHEI